MNLFILKKIRPVETWFLPDVGSAVFNTPLILLLGYLVLLWRPADFRTVDLLFSSSRFSLASWRRGLLLECMFDNWFNRGSFSPYETAPG